MNSVSRPLPMMSAGSISPTARASRASSEVIPDDGVGGLTGCVLVGLLGERADRRVERLQRDQPVFGDTNVAETGEDVVRAFTGHVGRDHRTVGRVARLLHGDR